MAAVPNAARPVMRRFLAVDLLRSMLRRSLSVDGKTGERPTKARRADACRVEGTLPGLFVCPVGALHLYCSRSANALH